MRRFRVRNSHNDIDLVVGPSKNSYQPCTHTEHTRAKQGTLGFKSTARPPLTDARPTICVPALSGLSGECRRSIEPLISIGARRRGSSLLAFSAWVHSRFFPVLVLDLPHLGFFDVAVERAASAVQPWGGRRRRRRRSAGGKHEKQGPYGATSLLSLPHNLQISGKNKKLELRKMWQEGHR